MNFEGHLEKFGSQNHRNSKKEGWVMENRICRLADICQCFKFVQAVGNESIFFFFFDASGKEPF